MVYFLFTRPQHEMMKEKRKTNKGLSFIYFQLLFMKLTHSFIKELTELPVSSLYLKEITDFLSNNSINLGVTG